MTKQIIQIHSTDVTRNFVEFAGAYLDSAAFLCSALNRSTLKLSYPRGAVVIYLTFHAVELFLKGAILYKSPEEKLHHDVECLRDRYIKLYPKEEFTFDIPFKAEFCGSLEPRKIKKTKTSQPPSQIWRYPTDSDGKLWDGVFAFEPTSFLADIRKLRTDFKRIQKLILAEKTNLEDNK